MASESLSRLIAQVAISHRALTEKLMTEIGLHAGQAALLAELWETDGQSQAELVRELGITPPTVNKLVARLTESGFVSSVPNEDDRRIFHVFLTRKGREIRDDVEKQFRKLDAISLAGCTETEVIMIGLLLKKMKDNLTSKDLPASIDE
jgi:DNA-binding MarR family transcriptional regulator